MNELTPEQIAALQTKFLAWYEQEKRNLPWRYNHDPYRIWISEIMLQQTRVDTVIDYFYRFMEAFPTIADLASAPEEKLLKQWEGLGYYSRARNLQAAAQQIMTDFDGHMPDSFEAIRTLKGIGPYTAGAIASIAFNLPEPAIDGNVMRVVSRLFEIEADIAKPASRKIFDEKMRQIISHKAPGDFNQALMDLGSSICTPKNPQCSSCPLQTFCAAYQHGTMEKFPIKSKKPKPKDVYYVAGIMENPQHEFLLQKRAASGLLANMWLFPLGEVSPGEFDALKNETELDLFAIAEEAPAIFPEYDVVWQKKVIGEVTHVFSHLKWHILIFYGRTPKAQLPPKNAVWAKKEQFSEFVFPKPQQKIIASWQKYLQANNH